MAPTTNAAPVTDILGQFDNRRASLIPLLQQIQASCCYLPEDALRQLACKLQVPLVDVYHIATFYRCFSLVPRGKHLVQVCEGTACHVRGSDRVFERMRLESGAGFGGTSPDGMFTVESVRCLGCCGLAPVVRVDRDTYARVELGKIRRILNKYRVSGRENSLPRARGVPA
jgi:NADH:ubiquinone oxidoreductase subunit E